MKKSNLPPKDPILKDILEHYDVPELPKGFINNVMESVRSIGVHNSVQGTKIPFGIKIGIPVFLLVCSALILIFPGNQQDPINQFFSDFSGTAILNFFDRISEAFQSYQLPEINLSKKSIYYIIGGVGLTWMYLLSELISRRYSKNKTSTS